MRALLIVNPLASRVTDELVERVRAELPPGTTVVRTPAPGAAADLAGEREREADAIFVLSGDGTYNEVLNGVTGAVPLGFLPAGGTSVLPRALGIGRDPVAAARALVAGRRRRIGLGRVNGRRFAFNAGLGVDAELVRRVDRRGRSAYGKRPGDLAFGLEAARLVAERRGRFPAILDIEGLGPAAFVLVANTCPYTYLGRLPLRVARDASFDAGLAVMAPVSLRPRDVPRFLLDAVRGGEPRGGLHVLRDTGRVVVRCESPTPLQVDGEDLGDVSDAAFEAEPDAVTVLVSR